MTHWPDLVVLELLVAVERQGSLSAAARACEVAQPNASRMIARLEQRIGLALLKRDPRGSTLTDEGRLIVEWAKSVLGAANVFTDSVAALGAKGQNRLSVGASLTVAEYLLPKWLSTFRQENPDSEIALEIHNSRVIFDQLKSGQLQLGFVESLSLRAGLHSLPVGKDEMIVVIAPDHPWADRRAPLKVDELAATALIMREVGSGTREFVDNLIQPYAPADPVLVVTSNASIKISVAAGLGPAVLSRLAVETQLRSGELLEVPFQKPIFRVLNAVWAEPRRPVGAAAQLIEIATRMG